MPKSISAAVGLHGSNLHDDTVTVQKLLNGVADYLGGPQPKLEEDGKCGPLTRAAIQKFQLLWFGWHGADSRVDPDGPTLQKLNALNPDPAVPTPPPPTPKPEPLATDFMIWLRFKGKYFSQPWKSDDFVFTVVDVSNNRDANYVLDFGSHSDIPPFPGVGSGGHLARITARKPSSVVGLGGPAVYMTTLRTGNGNAEDRLSSHLDFFPEAWREGSGISGISAGYQAHLFQPKPNEWGLTMSIPGRFILL